jgi:hypothetical protein
MKLSAITLLAAISDAKRKVLMDKYKVTEEIMTEVEAADPTGNSTYAEWICNHLTKGEFHLPEDRQEIRNDLTQFDKIRVKPEFKSTNSVDLNSYTAAKLKEALDKFKLIDPSRMELGPTTVILYQDPTYTLYKVTDVKDLVRLSRDAGWCTKSPGTAKSYLETGPDYVGFKNDEPLFQYDPNTGQFMNRHNTTMQSAKLMNEEAYKLVTKGAEKEPDLMKVIETFSAPNLSDAETFAYLKDTLETNPGYAKNNKEFKALEEKFILPRYRMFDLDEIKQLLERYPRAGEVISEHVEENKQVMALVPIIEAYPTFKEFKKCEIPLYHWSEKGPKAKLPDWGWWIVEQIPSLFSKVFAKFRQDSRFDEAYAQMKEDCAQKQYTPASTAAWGLVAALSNAFVHNDETDDSPRKKYTKIIANQITPLFKEYLTVLPQQLTTGSFETAWQVTVNTCENFERVFQQSGQISLLESIKTALTAAARPALDQVTEEGYKTFKAIREEFKEFDDYDDILKDWLKAKQVKMREERENRLSLEEREKDRKRYSPKDECERWEQSWRAYRYALRNKDVEDPVELEPLSDRGLAFMIKSPSIHINDKLNYFGWAGRNREFEKVLLDGGKETLSDAIDYAKRVIKGPWPELELGLDPPWRPDYIALYEGQIIPRYESFLAGMDYEKSRLLWHEYLDKHSGPVPRFEDAIEKYVSDPRWAGTYAYDKAQELYSIIEYCTKNRKTRWPGVVEDTIFEWGSEGEQLKYLFAVVPNAKEKIRNLLEESPENKTSSVFNMYAMLVRELQN